MPELRPDAGSDKWIQYMKKNIHQATFKDLIGNVELLKIFVKKLKQDGGEKVFWRLVLVHNVMCPHYVHNVSLCLCIACVLKHIVMCPYVFYNAYEVLVLMQKSMCPHLFNNMSLR